jgi:two-component system OmpR family sensor kinase
MSIRLRLTLLYTAILVLTLTAFSAILYGTQLQSILAGERRMLADAARRMAEHRVDGPQFEERPVPPWLLREEDAGDRRFRDRIFYMQFLTLEGQVINRSENLEEVDLPLSDAGWRAVRTGEPWAETASVEGERLLIHSAPVVVEGQVAEVVQVARSLADPYQYLSTMGRNLLIVGGAATIIAFGAGWVLSGAVLRPVNRITQTARAIGIERDFGRRVDHTGPNDEIGQLATTFNTMLTQLQAAYQQVERSLQQQRQFVADVSHELRTPLTTIRGNLALLRREPAVGAVEETDILEDMAGESDRLIRLVNDLLALAHAESGRQLQSETVWVKPLVEDVCRQARLLDPERTITCTDLADVAVVGDRDAFKQVLLILVDNALKHTDGAIAVSTAIIDEWAAIRMRDSGPGIDPEVLPYVFERFYRGDEARSRPGIGLGLPIARALVEAQNGTISIESQVGHGSIITVTLPRPSVQREDPEAARR